MSNEEIALIFGLLATFSYIWIRLLNEINRKIEQIRCYMYRIDNMLSNDVDKMYYNVVNLRGRLEKLFDAVPDHTRSVDKEEADERENTRVF